MFPIVLSCGTTLWGSPNAVTFPELAMAALRQRTRVRWGDSVRPRRLRLQARADACVRRRR